MLKFKKAGYSSKVLIIRKRAVILDRSHCSLKKSSNRLAFFKKSVTDLLFCRRDGISGIFEPLNVFEINQL